MAQKKLSDAYKTIVDDPFPPRMEIAFVGADGARTVLAYDKVLYEVEGERKGLRYGENPDQAAALYKPVGGNQQHPRRRGCLELRARVRRARLRDHEAQQPLGSGHRFVPC